MRERSSPATIHAGINLFPELTFWRLLAYKRYRFAGKYPNKLPRKKTKARCYKILRYLRYSRFGKSVPRHCPHEAFNLGNTLFRSSTSKFIWLEKESFPLCILALSSLTTLSRLIQILTNGVERSFESSCVDEEINLLRAWRNRATRGIYERDGSKTLPFEILMRIGESLLPRKPSGISEREMRLKDECTRCSLAGVKSLLSLEWFWINNVL